MFAVKKHHETVLNALIDPLNKESMTHESIQSNANQLLHKQLLSLINAPALQSIPLIHPTLQTLLTLTQEQAELLTQYQAQQTLLDASWHAFSAEFFLCFTQQSAEINALAAEINPLLLNTFIEGLTLKRTLSGSSLQAFNAHVISLKFKALPSHCSAFVHHSEQITRQVPTLQKIYYAVINLPFHAEITQLYTTFKQAILALEQRNRHIYLLVSALLIGVLMCVGFLLKGLFASRSGLQKNAEQLAHQKTMFSALIKANSAIMDVRDKDSLYQKMCDIAANEAQFESCWIGEVQANKTVKPMATAGLGGSFLKTITVSIDPDVPEGRGAVAESYATQKAVITNNHAQKIRGTPWESISQAWGIKGSATLPLFVDQQLIGFFVVYTAKSGLFNAQNSQLLQQLANDLSMALQKLSLNLKQQQDQQNLAIASIAFESHEAIIITDAHGRIIRTNRAFSLLSGYSRQEVLNKKTSEFKSGLHNQEFYASLWHSVITTGKWQGEIWNRKKDGTLYPSWISISAVHNADGVITHYISHSLDLTRDKESERKIHYLYNHDNLTKLPNRLLLLDRLEQQLASQNAHYCVLILINIHRFKMFNESLGHAAGDAILMAVGERVKNCKFDDVYSMTAARIGSDEFTLLTQTDSLDSESAIHQAGRIARRIQERLSEPFQINAQSVVIDTTLGITVFKAGTQKAEEIIQEAQTAVHRAKLSAKQSHHNTLQFYEPAMQRQAQQRLQLETDLRGALAQNAFVLHLQPQLDLIQNRIVGAESLIRWQPSHGELVAPNAFIPILEETGLIVPVGYWVLEESLKQALQIQAIQPDFTVAVNLSALQFNDEYLVQNIQSLLNQHNYTPHQLELEVTESVLMNNTVDALNKLNALAHLGIKIAIDDFGTGYSSLAYLKRFPVDKLKIDKSFIDDLNSDNPADTAIVQATIDMAHALNITTIAEGVETRLQQTTLTQMHCNQIQGYYLAKPLPLSDFLTLIKSNPA